MTNFQNLNLDPLLLKSLEAEGYRAATPIQAQAIPLILEGCDLLGTAQTGTGKTAAFALPILHKLNQDRRPTPHRGTQALILSPTRELASQIGDSFRTYGRHLGLKVAVIFGGVGYRPQINALQRGVDILVATPGRLIDHMNGGSISLETTEIFVLDEADQMLDLGFIRPLRQIIAKLPPRRQSLFFSATMPHEIGALASELLRNPARVAVTPVAKTADRVSQKVIFVEAPKKRSLLVELFGDGAMRRALIFTRTKRGADKVARHLEGAGIAAAAIHGNKSQGQREAALSAFKASSIRALVATDIAARGIDIDLVTHVINFELPNVPESYVHRIGRTARAGNEGIAISLCDGEERAYLKEIERLIRQTIPSADRRGDATLIATAAAPRSEARRDNAGNGGYRDRYARSMGRLNSGEKVHGPLRPAARVERDRDDRGPTRGAQAEHPHSQHHHPSEKSHRHGNGHRGQNNSHRRGGGHNPTHAPRAAHQGQGEARNGNRDQLHKNSAKAATRAHSDTNGQSGHYSNGHRSGNELRRDRGCRPEVRNESRSRRNDSTN